MLSPGLTSPPARTGNARSEASWTPLGLTGMEVYLPEGKSLRVEAILTGGIEPRLESDQILPMGKARVEVDRGLPGTTG